MSYKLYDAEIEYLESTGAYITLPIVVNKSTYVCIEYSVTKTYAEGGGADSRMFGVWNNNSICAYAFLNGANQIRHRWGQTNSANLNQTKGNRLRFTASGNTAKNENLTNGTSVSTTIGNSFPNANFVLFQHTYGARIYSAKIGNFDLIPVRVGNVGYMYDRVSGQLFGNSGTGSFVLGPDVAPGRYANEIAFLESTGSQYIDTGIKPTNNTRFVITMDLPKMDVNDLGAWFFGSRNGASDAQCGVIYDRRSSVRAWQWVYGNNQNVYSVEPVSGITVFDNYTTSGANELKINDLSLSVTANTFTGNYNFYLFTYNNAGNPTLANILIGQKLISAKLYEGTTLVRDFIPVEYNNIGYLYDKVSGQFFANQGTGKFVLGHRAPRFDGKACARSYTRRQLMLEENKRFSLLYHWEASDGIVNNRWIDRRKGYAFTKNGSPIVTTVSGYEVMRTNYDNYFKVNLNNPALNMGSEWMIAIEFIISVFPTDRATFILDFGALDNATHAFGLGVSTTKHVALNVKLTNNNNTFCPPVPPIEFTEYKMSTIIFGAEPYDSTHNNIYTIVGGVKTSASSYPTIANCRFNGNFSRSDGFFGRGFNGNFQSKSWKYIKSIKIYKDNKKR